MFLMINNANILTIESVYQSPFTWKIYQRCIFIIIGTIKLFSQLYPPLTHLKVQGAIPCQVLFGVKNRNVDLSFSKSLKVIIDNHTVTHRQNSRRFIIWYNWRRSIELMNISVIPVTIRFYLLKYIFYFS